MLQRITRPATMVVIEFSASWPSWLEPTGRDMAIVAQHYEGRPGSLLTQVASRTTRLEASGWQLNSLLFVSNGRNDAAAEASRSVLLRGLAARLRQLGSGQLLLTVDDRKGRRAAAQLRQLAASLSTLAGPETHISVRVGDDTWQVATESRFARLRPSSRPSARPFAPGYFATG